VRLPNNSTIQATHVGNLPYDHLPASATSTHIFPGLKSASLLSIGQLCDVGCKAVFRKRDLQIYDKLVINGKRNQADGLWDIDIPSTKSNPSDYTNNTKAKTSEHRRANAVLQLHKTKAELSQYLHAACFSPVPSTFIQAIKKGHFITWPGLTAELLITKHLPPSIATEKGHIKQEFKNIRSTQTPADQQDNAETTRRWDHQKEWTTKQNHT
jgi:hypothetical protein